MTQSKVTRVKAKEKEVVGGKVETEKKEPEKSAKKDDPYVEKQGFFEFVVLNYSGVLPGADDYDEKKDHLKSGFQFGGSTVPGWMPSNIKSIKEISGYDFLTNPKTGLRMGQKEPPNGAVVNGLDNGLNGWTDLSPLWVWNKGEWLSDLLTPNSGFDLKDVPDYFRTKIETAVEKMKGRSGIQADLFPYWVVSGEGTTGNFLYRIYKLPDEIAGNMYPKHPVLWRKDLKKSKSMYSGQSGGYSGSDYDYSGKKLTTSTDSSLPFGVRIRCGGCGHWFKSSDLPGHAKICGKGEEVDWAMMCTEECGCKTLDQASTPKPGFPRASVVKAEEPEPSATKQAADDREKEEAKNDAVSGAP